MRIFLVRHGLSQANADWSQNQRIADHAIELTEEGKRQAREAGTFLAKFFATEHLNSREIPSIRLWHSPYKRTRQTAEQIVGSCRIPYGQYRRQPFDHLDHIEEPPLAKEGDSWFMDDDTVDPLRRPVAHAREKFLLHEQQFGLFDGLSDEERRIQYPAETAYFEKCKEFGGRVWARLPMGESRMDVSKRVHQAFGSFKRDEEKHGIENIVVVAHGTVNRCFIQAWMQYTPEWLEQEPNPANCSIRLIEYGEDKGYIFPGFAGPVSTTGPNHEANE